MRKAGQWAVENPIFFHFSFFGAPYMSDVEKEQTIQEEDEQGNILIYPVWSKKNTPKERQDKWDVPIYL